MSGTFTPENPPGPTEDDLLTNLFQMTIVGITQLPGTLVRPMWQKTPPNAPAVDVDWCAVGIISRSPMDYPYMVMKDDTTIQQQRHEYLELMAMFYGPSADALAGKLRDGLYMPFNWGLLNQYGIRQYEVRETILVSYNTNMQYIGRCDLPFAVVRQLNREYPLPSLLGARGTIVPCDHLPTNWVVSV